MYENFLLTIVVPQTGSEDAVYLIRALQWAAGYGLGERRDALADISIACSHWNGRRIAASLSFLGCAPYDLEAWRTACQCARGSYVAKDPLSADPELRSLIPGSGRLLADDRGGLRLWCPRLPSGDGWRGISVPWSGELRPGRVRELIQFALLLGQYDQNACGYQNTAGPIHAFIEGGVDAAEEYIIEAIREYYIEEWHDFISAARGVWSDGNGESIDMITAVVLHDFPRRLWPCEYGMSSALSDGVMTDAAVRVLARLARHAKTSIDVILSRKGLLRNWNSVYVSGVRAGYAFGEERWMTEVGKYQHDLRMWLDGLVDGARACGCESHAEGFRKKVLG